jgi:hypothetical protein
MRVWILFDEPDRIIYGVFLNPIDAEIRKNTLEHERPRHTYDIEEQIVE